MSPMSGIRVLVVDDDADGRDILEQAFSFMGATVVTVPTADAAAGRLAEADMIVTDYALPGKDGVWLLQHIKASVPALPVILLSGFAASQIPAVAAAPFALKILKPVDPLELGQQIAALLGRSQN